MFGTRHQYKKMSLEEIIVLSQQNDLNAIEELIKRIQKNIFASLNYLSNNSEQVSDLTQEALIRIAKNLHSLKNPKLFKSWANQIVTHLYYDQVRKNNRKPETISLEQEIEDKPQISIQLPDKKCKPNEKCLSNELENTIKSAILALPEAFRIVIILREFQGLSYDEIAIATSSNVGTVKSRIARARAKLQEELKTYI